MTDDTKLVVRGITPDDIRIERGKPILYALMHPDDKPVGKNWKMQRRREGYYSLWRKDT